MWKTRSTWVWKQTTNISLQICFFLLPSVHSRNGKAGEGWGAKDGARERESNPAEHARNASYVLPPSDSLSKCISFFICAFSFRSSQHFLMVSHLFLAQNTVSIAPNLSAFSFVHVSHSLTHCHVNILMTAMMPSCSKRKFVHFNF